MQTLITNYSRKQVKIYLEDGLISRLTAFLNPNLRYFIITDERVASLYLDTVINQLPNFDLYLLPSGESSKNLEEVNRIINYMLLADIQKNDYLLALGGGVIGDVTAFVAAIYKRGINYLSVPTTLISQVDSCLGGKCGVDFSVGTYLYKNQIGTIYHPEMILVDPQVLNTLPRSEFTSGLSEVIKYGICFSPSLLEKITQPELLSEVIYACLSIKAGITERDEFDQGERMTLNYGHTIGHALESYSRFTLSHGQAVAIGMYYETKQPDLRTLLANLYQKIGINMDFSLPMAEIVDFIKKDKKTNQALITVPVLTKLGKVSIKTINLDDFCRGIK
ncbi:MAG TPA: 3-dehydroquinate synthase family protein [Bacilli bacterium]|nr:MAG: 3-dehydroquinate synthase [Tenericutes bacterium ADurb.BinA124]HNZ50263.1 3-dehydroquinate synthase family protein [Bacilli bacterium]HPN60961.1 3-dehydroquinate synthase family protein [Bacilli bacterium]HPX84642.1 3-dehydroquinate synthase family protein [Bacilli bacterium]HQC74303.1 3-dehydroquinate synthase family protein [Bacilli bacterium]